MTVVAWFLLIFFGMLSLYYMEAMFNKHKRVSWIAGLFMVFSAIVTALSAGVIWGGLLQ